MECPFIVHNLVHYEVAYVIDDPYEFIILVDIPCHVLLFFPLQENKFRSSIAKQKLNLGLVYTRDCRAKFLYYVYTRDCKAMFLY
jgi:hypothetical protein